MAGPMSALCQAVRSQATELLLLGRPLPAALTRHLAGCEECAAECEGVRRVVRTFERAEGAPSQLPAPGLLPLPSAVPVPAPSSRPWPRRTRRLAVLAAAAVLAAIAILVPVAVHDRDSGPVDVVTVAREGLMIPHPWGTEVPVSLSGLTPGRTYRMMTADADGNRVPAGSLTAPGPGARTRMMTAMARDSIKSLLVEDQDGRLVADLPVRPLRSSGHTPDGTAPDGTASG